MVTVIIRIGSFALLYIQKTSCYLYSTLGWFMALLYVAKKLHNFHYFFLKNDYSGNTVGQDQNFWTTDMGKQRFEEQCFRYNSTLFIWVIFLVWRKCRIIVGKRRIQEQRIEVSLNCRCCLSDSSQFNLRMWLVMWKFHNIWLILGFQK